LPIARGRGAGLNHSPAACALKSARVVEAIHSDENERLNNRYSFILR
jgi:hypothetical protein